MTRGRPFEPGNKFGRGRPRGSRNKSTSVGQRLLEQHHESLMRRTIAAGLKEDTKSRLWCLNELNREPRPAPKLKLPPIKTLDDIARAQALIFEAVANRKCTAAEGLALCGVLDAIRKMIDTQDLALRLEELERLVKKTGS